MEKNDKKCIQIILTQEQIQMLERVSKMSGLSESEVVGNALEYYVRFFDFAYDKLMDFIKK